MTTRQAVKLLIDQASGDTIIVCCNGYISRFAYQQFHKTKKRIFYNVGAMGTSLAFGAGIAHFGEKVLVIDGDANFFMGGINSKTWLRRYPTLTYVVLCNNRYLSCKKYPINFVMEEELLDPNWILALPNLNERFLCIKINDKNVRIKNLPRVKL